MVPDSRSREASPASLATARGGGKPTTITGLGQDGDGPDRGRSLDQAHQVRADVTTSRPD
jgi:hypothetical protein